MNSENRPGGPVSRGRSVLRGVSGGEADDVTPRDLSAYASDEHLARLVVRCLTGQWAYALTTERWVRWIEGQWVATLPHEMREYCEAVIEAVIRDAERIPDELRNDPRLIDRLLVLVADGLRG